MVIRVLPDAEAVAREAAQVIAGEAPDDLDHPILNRCRHILWLVTGSEKAGMLVCLIGGDSTIPAGRVHRARALVLADRPTALLTPTRMGPKSNRRRFA